MPDWSIISEWGNTLAVVAIVPCCMLIGGLVGVGRSTLVALSGLLALFTAICTVNLVQERVVPHVEQFGVAADGIRATLPAAVFVAVVAVVWVLLGSVAVAKVGLVIRRFDSTVDRLAGGVVGGCGGVLFAASLQCTMLLAMASLEQMPPPAGREMAAASLVLKSYSRYMATDYEQTLDRFIAVNKAAVNKGNELPEDILEDSPSEDPAAAVE